MVTVLGVWDTLEIFLVHPKILNYYNAYHNLIFDNSRLKLISLHQIYFTYFSSVFDRRLSEVSTLSVLLFFYPLISLGGSSLFLLFLLEGWESSLSSDCITMGFSLSNGALSATFFSATRYSVWVQITPKDDRIKAGMLYPKRAITNRIGYSMLLHIGSFSWL